ncbi:MAG: sugar phosphate isomerase/epimerase [Lentisphaeria bacterium]|nr:sugar phosphate isomerase/epimerase [Lentisphaeria bacterium]
MPEIKLACMSLMWGMCNLANDQVPQWIDDIKAADYDGVALFDGELRRMTDEIDFKSLLNDHGLSLASVDYFIDNDNEHLHQVCEIMQSYKSRHLVTIGGLATPEADPQEIADILNVMGEIALTYDIHACYHNHTNDLGETCEQTENLLSLTDPNKFFGFVDTGHATKDFIEFPVAERATRFLQRNWERIDFIEFKDWSEQYDLCTELGAGTCDYVSVFALLKEKKYSGWITVEQNGVMGDKTAAESAKASADFIRKGLEL